MSDPCIHEADWGAIHQWQTDADRKLDAILDQVRSTNGRIRALEQWRLGLAVALSTTVLTLAPGSQLAQAIVGIFAK